MKLEQIVVASADVAATPSRNDKVSRIARVLADTNIEEVAIAVAFLSGVLRQGRLGIGQATLAKTKARPGGESTLSVANVNGRLDELAATTGPGSRQRRQHLLEDLFANATKGEQEFLKQLMAGELRQGALEGVMAEAVAEAFAVAPEAVRRAAMLGGDLGVVARAAAAGELEAVNLRLFQPLQPMLAQTADTAGEAIARLGRAGCEWKIDGARIQVHRSDEMVKIFTRNLKEVTARTPEIVESLASLSGTSFILDGELIALQADGRPHPFQVTMSRFGRRDEREPLLTPFFFDCLHYDGSDLIDTSGEHRFDILQRAIPPEMIVPRLVTGSEKVADNFLHQALDAGHEGMMVKSLEAPYEAGRRGSAWIKVKPAHTLDLVVLAAEWGHGRRTGLLSNLHLGARDDDGSYVMLGKTFKGLTDATLQWQTNRLLELERSRDGMTVFVRPELVVEIAFDGIQASSRYEGGMALRFARVKGYREDKTPDESDTLETVRSIYRRSMGLKDE